MEFRNRVKIIVAMICLNVKIYSTVQKMKFSIKNFLGKRDQILGPFTEEILYGKLHFLCSGYSFQDYL